jgi:CBS domain-containing protein
MSHKSDMLEHVMSIPVITINAIDTLRVAAECMVKNNIGAIVVVEGNKPVGIVTERDVTKQVITGNDALTKLVSQVMSHPLRVSTKETTIQEAFEIMLEHRIRRLPIVANNELVGIVTEKDLMRWVLRVSYEPNIPKHIRAVLDSH